MATPTPFFHYAAPPKSLSPCAVPLRVDVSAALAACLTGWGTASAAAHDAKSGWSYPYACCSGYDCREVPQTKIRERPEGYVIENTGEVVAYSDTRVRNSPDGEYHWCSVAGANDSRTICLFVPPKSF